MLMNCDLWPKEFKSWIVNRSTARDFTIRNIWVHALSAENPELENCSLKLWELNELLLAIMIYLWFLLNGQKDALSVFLWLFVKKYCYRTWTLVGQLSHAICFRILQQCTWPCTYTLVFLLCFFHCSSGFFCSSTLTFFYKSSDVTSTTFL